jgi:hypothetical protein
LFDRELAATTAAMGAPGKGIRALAYPLSFLSGGASRAPALKAWKGLSGSVAAAQKGLFRRANLSSAACFGRYKAEMEKDAPAA